MNEKIEKMRKKARMIERKEGNKVRKR